MKIAQPIPRKSSHGKGSIKKVKNACHKCSLTIKTIEQDKDKDKLVKSKPPTQGKGKSQSFEDQLHLLVGNEVLEKIIYWTKDVQDKLVTT